MNAADVTAQALRVIAYADTRLRRGLISPEEHLITVNEVLRWALRTVNTASEPPI